MDKMVSDGYDLPDGMVGFFRRIFLNGFQVFIVDVKPAILIVYRCHMLRVPEGMGQEVHDKGEVRP